MTRTPSSHDAPYLALPLHLENILRAVSVEGVTVDIAFVISDTLYYGPPNAAYGDVWRTMQAPLRQPEVPRRGAYAMASDLAAAPSEIIAHYEDVFRRATEHGVALRHRHPAFWLRP